jgi:dTDP-4-dehydrorhamnose 3,5-epimerase
MEVRATAMGSVMILTPSVIADDRGFFYESYTQMTFAEATGSTEVFVQDNHSRSVRGVIRGLHYQVPPHAQGKLVRCVRGEIFDAVVDIRDSSDTFGQWTGVVLGEENRKHLWVPAGFAHGFLALSDLADVVYKTTDYYTPESERSIRWDDPTIGIDWPDIGVAPILANKDAQAPLLQDAETFD